MTVLDHLADIHVISQMRPDATPVMKLYASEDYKAGFRAAKKMISEEIGKRYPYPDGKGLWIPTVIHEIGEEEAK